MNYSIIVLLALVLVFTVPEIIMSQDSQLKYKTVYLEDLCSEIQTSKDILLLDVRSQGEFDDTSAYSNLNIGKFSNAVNISISELEGRLSELEKYRNKSVYVYCSHSNRSREASRILTENGFSDVHNVNGGLSTWVHDNINCSDMMYTSSLKYKLYSPKAVRDFLTDPGYAVIDIRPRGEYEGKSDKEVRNLGRIKNVINIPYDELEKRIPELDKNKKIILVDLDCSLSPKAADMLANNGFDAGIMVFGLFSWIVDFPSTDNLLENIPEYKYLAPVESCPRLQNGNDILILDIRTVEEFTNKAEMEHRNIGRLKNAVNIPTAELEKRINELEKFRDKEILLYEFTREGKSSEAAQILTRSGFKNVNIIAGGLYGLEWRQKNIKNFCLPLSYIDN